MFEYVTPNIEAIDDNFSFAQQLHIMLYGGWFGSGFICAR